MLAWNLLPDPAVLEGPCDKPPSEQRSSASSALDEFVALMVRAFRNILPLDQFPVASSTGRRVIYPLKGYEFIKRAKRGIPMIRLVGLHLVTLNFKRVTLNFKRVTLNFKRVTLNFKCVTLNFKCVTLNLKRLI